MKNWKNWLGAAALALPMALGATPATEVTPIVRVKNVDNQSIHLVLANLEQVRTTVELQDVTGKTVFSTFVKNHNGYAVRLDLQKLAPGRYFLEVRKGNELVSKVVRVTEDGVLVAE